MDALCEIHEERIQRLEDGFSKVSAQLAANTVALESVGDRFTAGVTEMNGKFDQIITHVNTLTTSLQPLQYDLQRRTGRNKALGRIAYPVLATLFAAVLLAFFRLK